MSLQDRSITAVLGAPTGAEAIIKSSLIFLGRGALRVMCKDTDGFPCVVTPK